MTMTTIIDQAARSGGPRSAEEPRGRTRRFRVLTTGGALAVATIVGAGIGSGAWAGTPTVQVATNATFGAILTNGSGFALYTLNTDHNGQSTCHGSCAAAWPPLNVPAGTAPTVGPGVTGTVGTAKQSNGTFQVTYNGSPLYTFVGDSAAGEVTGNGVTGFSVVRVAQPTTTTTAGTTPVTAPPTGTASSTGTTGSSSPATASSGPPPSSSPAPASSMTSAAPGALAFTGPGPGLRWLALIGLVMTMVGTVIALGPRRRERERTP